MLVLKTKVFSLKNNLKALRTMKKFIISLSFALLGIGNLFAAKAYPGLAKITLADGATVTARLYGDEHFHYYATLDGTPLKLNTEGKYILTTYEELQARQAEALEARKNAQTIEMGNIANISRASSIGTGSNYVSYFPHTGSPKALVLLVQFQDVKFKSADPVATFNYYLNAKEDDERPAVDIEAYNDGKSHTNYGSVRQYFESMSMGQFIPQFDIVGPLTVSKNSAYYGKDTSSPGNGSDDNYRQMISEACAQAADKVDFSQYDSDGDGYVDLVYVIYAGYSQSWGGNSDDCLWPKSGTNTFYKYDTAGNRLNPLESLKYNGVTIKRFGINNELNETSNDKDKNGRDYINGIGLFCHEFSHTLGLPDLYDNNGDYNDQSPDYWDLMDGGEYTNNGYCPTPYSPWEKEMMGWVTPITLAADQPQQLTLEPYSDTNSKCYKIEAEKNGEYLLLQSIQNTGWYQYLYGYGMLVWRIDYADKSFVNLFDYPNNTKGKPRVMIVPADGELLYSLLCGDGKEHSDYQMIKSAANDPFPAYGIGENGKDIDCLTSVKLNHSTLTTRPLYNIKKDEATGIVTFDYLKDFSATGIENAITVKDADNRPIEYFDLEGRKITFPQKGHLYVTNKGKKIIF